jgi:FkbM family methyltransferase
LKALGGRTVYIRPGTSDAQVVWDTFVGRYHVPPAPVARSARRIWDLGANIGLTALDLAERCPGASLTAVELDAGNAELARSNIATIGHRCELIEGAVWPEDGRVAYDGDPGDEHGFRVVSRAGQGRSVAAISLNTLLERQGGAPVDYVKMDVEGAEPELLRRNTQWAAHVRCLTVEVHGPYSVDDCRRDLQTLGFDASVSDRHWASVTGHRQD